MELFDRDNKGIKKSSSIKAPCERVVKVFQISVREHLEQNYIFLGEDSKVYKYVFFFRLLTCKVHPVGFESKTAPTIHCYKGEEMSFDPKLIGFKSIYILISHTVTSFKYATKGYKRGKPEGNHLFLKHKLSFPEPQVGLQKENSSLLRFVTMI
jgi:hypothetical protein